MSAPILFPLAQADRQALETLLDAVFGADRHNRTAYRLRDDSDEIAALSFGLADGHMLVASIQCWPVELVGDDDNICTLVLLGPVAVSPTCQKRGYGRRLMLASLSAALEMGDPAMMLVGDPEYYGLFGFSAEATRGWRMPGPWEAHRLLARNPQMMTLPTHGTLRKHSGKAP